MLIVDSQIHLWDKGQAPPTHRQAPYLAHEAIADMDAAGVHVAINHPPNWDQDSNTYAVTAASLYPQRLATLGWLKLNRPEAPDQVRRWRQQPGMIGFRFICVAEDERAWPQDGTMDWLWPLAEELGLPIALAGPALLSLVPDLATRYPNLKLTLDHFGMVGTSRTRGLLQAEDLEAWSRYPNVAVKLTGAPDYATDEYPFVSMHDRVRRLYDAYGPRRLFWGSDITRLKCTWRQCVTMFTEEMPWLSQADKSEIMGEAFCRWHDWRPAVSA